jgi:hypothetical protein
MNSGWDSGRPALGSEGWVAPAHQKDPTARARIIISNRYNIFAILWIITYLYPHNINKRICMKPDAIERFWAKKVVTDSGCWEWTGQRAKPTPHNPWKYGYGKVKYVVNGKKKNYIVHRLAWELVNGLIPDGMMVLHKCDNPPCFNPEHLKLGTHQENMDDMVQRGRAHGAYLDSSIYVQIKDLRKDAMEYSDIAITLGVSRSVVHRVLRGDMDRHLPEEYRGAVQTRKSIGEKITREIAIIIREAYGKPGGTRRDLASLYGITKKHVHAIAKGKCWKNI